MGGFNKNFLQVPRRNRRRAGAHPGRSNEASVPVCIGCGQRVRPGASHVACLPKKVRVALPSMKQDRRR
jgi:hypothetical protein